MNVFYSSGWRPSGSVILSMASDCAATLQYTANLVKAGEVRFSYQYTDDDAVFHFTVSFIKVKAMMNGV